MAEAYDPLTLGRSGFSQDYDAMPLPRESRADDTGDGLNQTLPDRKCYTCQPCRSFSGLIGSGTSPAIPPDVLQRVTWDRPPRELVNGRQAVLSACALSAQCA